jgi:hypothetical protein
MNTHVTGKFKRYSWNSCTDSILGGTVSNEAGYTLTPRLTVKKGLIGPKPVSHFI